MKKAIILIVILIAIIGLAIGIFYWNKDVPQASCTKLGCNENAKYVGSINSDKYYLCDCHYANRINSENIVCFNSDKDATSKGHVKSDC